MWKHRIAYLFLLGITFLLYIFYVGYTSWFLFVIVCSLPLLSIGYALLAKHTIVISLQSSQDQYERGDTMKLILQTHMRSVFPIAKMQGKLQIINHLTKEIVNKESAFVSAHSTQVYEMEETLPASGKYTCSFQDIKAYDLLGLVGFSIKTNANCSVYCLPKPQICAFELPELDVHTETAYDPNRKGNDRSETFDVRTYQPGDSLHAVHWKLSAKMDDLMVREFSSPLTNIASLCFDLYGSFEDVEKVLSNLYGGSIYLLMNEQVHDVIQYEKGVICLQQHIQNRQMLDLFMRTIFDHDGSFSERSSLPYMNSTTMRYYVSEEGITNPSPKRGEPYA